MSSISVSCPCGEVFERPIQRGRPAIWCPTCRLLPIAQRSEKPATMSVVTTNSEGETVEVEVETRTISRFGTSDTLNYTEREAVEGKVEAIKAEYQALKAEGKSPEELSAWEFKAYQDAYKSVKSKWWQNKGE